ncbi:hypothetical protein B5X24_HaOG203961 [Helicoverpa armigera]|uniref:FLYWCH-type domain-containing protein n=1 Tax=Helicoverpa armigera TaxID=29058 RepID=A0A2W1BW42_HELAM|nr:hypothetical protein B5X24_HaOG203961 [Helicoverpa armigera]
MYHLLSEKSTDCYPDLTSDESTNGSSQVSSDVRPQENFRILQTPRGDILLRNGFEYFKRYIYADGNTVWQCLKPGDCCATIITRGSLIVDEQTHKCNVESERNRLMIKQLQLRWMPFMQMLTLM